MKITEAKSAYYKQYQKFSFAAADVAKQKEEAEKNARLHPDKAEEFNKQAATLEISLEALNKQKEEYMKHNEKIAEMECAYANMIVSQQQSEAMEESAAEELKILETARRIMKGDIVPPQDEEKPVLILQRKINFLTEILLLPKVPTEDLSRLHQIMKLYGNTLIHILRM